MQECRNAGMQECRNAGIHVNYILSLVKILTFVRLVIFTGK